MLANSGSSIEFGSIGKDLCFLKSSRAPVLAAACLIIIGALCAACGKRRPPLPPVRAVADNYLTAAQRGNEVLLKITLPPQAKEIKQISVYRLNEALNTQAPLSEDDFASKSTLIGIATPLSNASSKIAYYRDSLSSTTPRLSRLRYAVRLVFADGRRSGLSNFLMIEPTFRVPLSPVLAPPRVTQSVIQLEWQKPSANLDASQPANIAGYNVYRVQTAAIGADGAAAAAAAAAAAQTPALAEGESPQLLNASPLTETTFNDATFQFDKSYRYFIRAVSTNTSAGGSSTAAAEPAPIESQDSNAQTVIPRDTFAPAAPQNLTIAAAPGRLSLFFAANSEPDLAGYLVFRARDRNLPLTEWQKVTSALLSTNTFQDTAVESGGKYYYYLRAVDQNGNTSEPSEIVGETVP